MSCINCKWDRLNPQGQRMVQCEQGHIRSFQKIIENCHAYEEKVCWWCRDFKDFTIGFKGNPFYEVVKKLIWLNPNVFECPICGKKYKEEW